MMREKPVYRPKICKNVECGNKFQPTHPTNEYCSRSCFEYNRRKKARIREKEARQERLEALKAAGLA